MDLHQSSPRTRVPLRIGQAETARDPYLAGAGVGEDGRYLREEGPRRGKFRGPAHEAPPQHGEGASTHELLRLKFSHGASAMRASGEAAQGRRATGRSFSRWWHGADVLRSNGITTTQREPAATHALGPPAEASSSVDARRLK